MNEQPWTKSQTECIRDDLVDLFLSAGGLTGSEASEQLGISRTAVWKHIQSLQTMGFQFDSSPRVGYRLLAVPDVLMEPLLRRALPVDTDLGRVVTFAPEVDSTNRVAMDAAERGAPHGTVVTALRQTGGRGRRGRPWFSPPDGAWFSVVLQHPMPLRRAAELTLIASVVLRRALVGLGAGAVAIKWPNDLLLGGRKISGILAEIRADGEQVQRAVLGIGVNCNTPAADFPEALRDVATSVFAETGRKVDRIELVSRFLSGFQPYYDALVRGEAAFARLHEEWTTHSHTLGRSVRVQVGGQVLAGTAVRLDPSGALVLRMPSGSETEVMSGDVLFDDPIG
ncbi:MAG: biotin--[acetyl-CoA-carboxylase] ligase [Alicyclobacillus sp.]|nr:biotin--[acetyl-CoA-carboxylase] ligase [Alicyclobacillus sp.]